MKDPFGKSAQGTYSKPYQIINKTFNKNHWNDNIVHSHSFLLQADNNLPEKGILRLMAYALNAGPNYLKYIPPRREKKT